jgi:KDO2-lipid IV(A) lauroyltransferase
MTSSRRHSLAHRVEYVLYRSVETALAQLPLQVVGKLGEVLGLAAWRLSRKHRELVTRNLRIVTASEGTLFAERADLVPETFKRAGRNLLSSLRSALMTTEELRPHLELDGAHHITDQTNSGTGVVLVWAHMGNWEMLAQAYPFIGGDLKGGPIYRPLENALVDELTMNRRTKNGAMVFDKHAGFTGPAKVVRDGGMVTVMSDQRAGGQGELCPFFGRLSSCTPLPGILARRAKGRIATLSTVGTESGAWKMTIRSVPENADTATVMKHLEIAMRDGLTDVFWFHDRWRVDKRRPLSFYTKQSPTVPAKDATVPTRLLATIPRDSPEALATLTRILEIRPDVRIDLLDDGTLPPLPADDRIRCIEWDPHCPPEHLEGVVQRSDESHAVPLDFLLALDGHRDLGKAARKFGLRSVIGCGNSGKPWTFAFDRPTTIEGWQEIAEALAATPSSGKA